MVLKNIEIEYKWEIAKSGRQNTKKTALSKNHKAVFLSFAEYA